MKKIINVLFYVFLIFLVTNPIWPFYKKLNYLFIISFFILSILVLILSDKKKIEMDKIDIMLGLLPLSYFIPYITKTNLYNIRECIYYILFEISITTTILILRRYLTKEKIENVLITLCTTGCIYFFVSYIHQLIPKTLMLLSIFNYFGDTYINSVDRFYGTLDYCNSSALFFLITTFISLFKIIEDKENKNFFRFSLLINFTGFLVTFSKMLTIAFLLVLITLIVLQKLLKRKEFLKEIKTHLIGIIIPSLLFVRLHRIYLSNLNIIHFVFIILLLTVLYIGICELLNHLDNKWKYSSYLYLSIIMLLLMILTFKPISTSLKIKNVSKNNEYIIYDFILAEDKAYKVEFNTTGKMKNVSFQLYKLYLKDLAPTIELISEIDSGKENKFNFKTEKDFEYYFIKVVNLDKNTNIEISNFKINNKEHLINSFIIPYQYIHQLDLIKYDKESVSHRFLYYKDSLKIIKDNKYIFGEGYNSFAYHAIMGEFDYLENDPHSYLFQLWLDTGIYGLFYVLGLIIIGINNMWKNHKDKNKVIWFCIFSLCMIVLPFDCIYSVLYPKVLLMLSFIMTSSKIPPKKTCLTRLIYK